jgi:hypothetical protein
VQGSLLGAGVALLAALLVIVNYLGWKYHARLDWTETGFYELSEQTENVLAGLDRDVEVVVFMAPGGQLYEHVRELLRRYEATSPRITVRWLDPERNPAEVQRLVDQYGVTTRSVVFTSGEQRRAVPADDLQELDFSSAQLGGQPEVSAFKGERLFTDALVDLTREEVPRVLFTTGHGELSLDGAAGRGLAGLMDVLGRDNFGLEEWSSREAEAVPEDADLVVIAGPTSAFLPGEIELLDSYLTSGGRLIVLIDPVFAPGAGGGLVETGLEDWLAGYGVELGSDLVLDPVNRVVGYGPETFVVDDYTAHPVTGSLGERGIPAIVSVARSVGSGTVPDGVSVVELLRTGRDAWGETDFDSVGEAAAGDGEPAGPLPLAVAVEGSGPEDEAPGEPEPRSGSGPDAETGAPPDGESESAGMRLAVLGDSDLAAGLLVSNPGLGNSALLNNLFNWMVERRSLLGIPPKRPEQVRLSMTPNELRWSVLGVTLILPGLAVIFGLWVWRRRRKVS